MKLVKNTILGVGITNASQQDILEEIREIIGKREGTAAIFTPNPEILVKASRNPEYRDLLNQARIALPDGVGVMWAGKLLNRPFQERITGVDMLEKLCEKSVEWGGEDGEKIVSVGFFGGKDGVAELAAQRLAQHYPGVKISFIGEDWSEAGFHRARELFGEKNHEVRTKKQDSQIDILFVALGAPKQEKWIIEHQNMSVYRVAMGVGGAFDFLSRRVSRAPRLVRKLGFEWLFRLIRQPWRLKRQLRLIEFVYLILKEKYLGSSSAS